jgi:CheY-like chemotaxis protein
VTEPATPAPLEPGATGTAGGDDQGAFLRLLAHELRNYIAPMHNAMHLLRLKSRTDPTLGAVIDIVERQLTAMSAAVDAVSEADRVRRGELVLNRTAARVQELVENAVTSAARGHAAQRQRVIVDVTDRSESVDVDAARMTRAVAALIENALRYSGDTSLVRVTTRPSDDALDISVEDSGRGMAPEMRSRALDFGGVPHQPGHGLGLGLPLAATVIQAHGGTLALETSPSGGLRAVIRIPVLGARPAGARDTTTSNEQRFSGATAGRRVLLADDSAAVRTSLSDLLTEMGHDVRCAADGAEAVAVAEDWRPEFVLLDIHMPKLNGFEAARKLRKSYPPSEMQLVMMSGDDLDDVVRQGARRAGFDHCIDKGLAIGELSRILAQGVGNAPV